VLFTQALRGAFTTLQDLISGSTVPATAVVIRFDLSSAFDSRMLIVIIDV
jgi:hypothetical protein